MSSVAAVQVRVDDKETADERVDRVLTMLRETCRPADLVLLPELWPVGAFSLDRVLSWAQPIDGPFAESMATLARDWGAVLHAGSFPERHAGGVSNTSIVFGPDGDLLTSYRKIHLFGFDAGEAAAVSAGSDVAVLQTPLGITGLTTTDGRVSIMMPHPERVMRTVSNSWHPDDWNEASPWLRMFRNARVALG